MDPIEHPHYQEIISKKIVQNSTNFYREGRIVGGKAAVLGQFEYHVLLYAFNRRAMCGASLIRYNWVLTAAHCVYHTKNLELHFGTINRTENSTKVIKIEDESHIKIHDNYDDSWLLNDIALIYLEKSSKSILDSPYIGIIELPLKENIHKEIGTVCGFGKTSDEGGASLILNYIKNPIMSMESCKEFFEIDETNVCIDTENGESPCAGDSGGALAIQTEDNQRITIGIVSFGHRSCTARYPVVFTRVSAYLSWIEGKFLEFENETETTSVKGTTTESDRGTTNSAPKVTYFIAIILNVMFLLNKF